MASRSQKDLRQQRLARTPAQDLDQPQAGEAPNTDEDLDGYRDNDQPARGEGPDVGAEDPERDDDADDGDAE